MKKLFKSKKGDAVIDSITILLVVFAFALITLSVYRGYTEAEPSIRASLNETGVSTVNQSLASLDVISNNFPSVFDGAILVILIGLWIFALVSAYFIDSHPLFLILSVILLIFVLIASAIITNAGQEILDDSVFSSVTGSFPITTWIISHLLIVILVIGFSIVAVLYGKSRGGA